jgi:hypothetical protein
MSRNSHTVTSIRYLWEALFCLHVAFAAMSAIFISSVAMLAPFSRMEYRINELFRIPQTDFVRGYFAIWISSVLLAVLMLVPLRGCARSRCAEEFVRSVGGFITLLIPLMFWVFIYQRTFWPIGWPYEGAPFEIAITLVVTALFVSGRWGVPSWIGLLLLVLHYLYWYIAPSSDPLRPNYMGPFGPILGFCSAVAWATYITRIRKSGGVREAFNKL